MQRRSSGRTATHRCARRCVTWGRALGGSTRQSQPHEPSGDGVPSARALWISPPSTADVRPRKLAARRARHRPVRCSQWVSGWLGSPWGRALGGSTRQSQPHEPSGDGVPSARALWISPPSTADVRPRKLAARRARHRPVRCSQWVSGWLGSPWGIGRRLSSG